MEKTRPSTGRSGILFDIVTFVYPELRVVVVIVAIVIRFIVFLLADVCSKFYFDFSGLLTAARYGYYRL